MTETLSNGPGQHGILVRQSVNSSLVSVAGLILAPVRDLEAHDVGHLVDVVVRWDRGVYPQVSGLVIRIGSGRSFVHVADVSSIGRREVKLGSTRVDLTDFARRPGEQLLCKDVIDERVSLLLQMPRGRAAELRGLLT
jgi:hypothetical protein